MIIPSGGNYFNPGHRAGIFTLTVSQHFASSASPSLGSHPSAHAAYVLRASGRAGAGPSWGIEYKVKPNGKVEVSGGVGLALKGGAEVNNDYFSISTGYTKEFGIKAGASVGIDFGPYFPGVFGNLNRDYSTSIGFGAGSVGMSGGKDGIGFSFSVGPGIGFTGSATGSHDEKIDLNGDSTKEIYHYDFK